MTLKIVVDDLSGTEVVGLLTEHLESMASLSPPESVHALDVVALKEPGVTFWSAWNQNTLAGCGALQRLNATHAEIKSMRTARHCQRQGVAQQILRHILQVATAEGYRRLSLETGSMEAFAPARALYRKHGFAECQPFADYVTDPNSVFMTKSL